MQGSPLREWGPVVASERYDERHCKHLQSATHVQRHVLANQPEWALRRPSENRDSEYSLTANLHRGSLRNLHHG